MGCVCSWFPFQGMSLFPCISCPFSDHRRHPERKLLPLHEPQLWAKLWDPKGKMLGQILQLLPLESSNWNILFLYFGDFCCCCISDMKTPGFKPGALLSLKLPSAAFPRIGLSWESKPGVEPGITLGIFFPQWTVNGQLRVGFFTTKLVPSGSELTFDYQFQRYGYVPLPGTGIPALPLPHSSYSIPFPDNYLPCFFLSDC